ncbi:MAG: diaminohydroxyphosphoribosylaminopyrimidine deaminase [Bacillota bacterium]|nr:MAG: diaminohydroxyphosphoribosylaminopyrimidine deaminase [Bacillota bacterium]
MLNEHEMKYMVRALDLAAIARGRTSPNPMVGAVVVKDGEVIGEGYHPRAGDPHAEVFALAAAGEAARNADLYVTLEPCCHYGRTPPCSKKILGAGIRRTVVATLDPNPLVAGKGVAELRAAGVMVEVGLRGDEARRLNEAFFTYMTKRRPFVTSKWAMTLDGKTACASGDSRWVSGVISRKWVHELRDEVDAIMVGIGTVLTDDPELTTRLPEKNDSRDPIRIIVDSHLRTPPEARLFKSGSKSPTWIACLDSIEFTKSPLHSIPNVQILPLSSKEGRVDLDALLSTLWKRKINHVLLEGGGTLNYTAFSQQIIDKVYCLIAPKIVGGAQALSPVGGDGLSKMSNAWNIDVQQVVWLGEDMLVKGYPIYSK